MVRPACIDIGCVRTNHSMNRLSFCTCGIAEQVLVSGAGSSMVAVPMVALTQNSFDGSWTQINALSLVLCAVSLHLPMFLWRQEQQQQRERAEATAAAVGGKQHTDELMTSAP